MPTTAVVTIAFLPAIAISSLFSTGMFDWQSDGPDRAFSTRCRIYWVVTAPMTLAFLGLYFG